MPEPNKTAVVVKGIILYEERILLIKRSPKDAFGAETWECPGGKIEFGESLEDALVREVTEEAGLEAAAEKLVYATSFLTDPARQVVILTYLCRSETNQVLLSAEHTEYQWVPLDQVNKFLPPGILADFEKNNVAALLEDCMTNRAIQRAT
ncbi:NUDIX domain-containing protein [Metabacillus sp. GX 13764]|uniref:NUDIX hydrolase n=1 Tax=Metabacillus kandeliae TaxID=2900151 RepID=UPI001E577C7B|nr:NUDIX domain-containing protein [Metabacillus kandeliae]MCD7034151.1 NUDIX domain-containing protein [Metabacillus kandeliae]